MYLIAFSFGYTSYQLKADHEAAEHFACHRGPSTKDSENWLTLLLLTLFRKTKYADLLRSIFYCYLPTFGKLTRRQLSVDWRMRSSHKNDFERDWCGLD